MGLFWGSSQCRKTAALKKHAHTHKKATPMEKTFLPAEPGEVPNLETTKREHKQSVGLKLDDYK